MRQLVLLQLRQMIANQLGRQPFSFAAHFELHQQTFTHVTRAAADRLEPHDRLAGLLDYFFRPTAHRAISSLVAFSRPSASRFPITQIGRVAHFAFRGLMCNCHSR